MADAKPLTHLGIDSSALIGAGWPRLNDDAESVLATCEALGLPVLIPELVLIEVEAVWNRHTLEHVGNGRTSLGILAKRGLLDISATKWPDAKSIEEGYKKLFDAFNASHKYEVPPIPPKLSLKDALTSAALATAPFPEGDISFRDAMIAVSLFEALKAGDDLAFLTTDKGFKTDVVFSAAREKGIGLHVFGGWREVLDRVETMARNSQLSELFQQIEEQQNALLHQLREDSDSLEAYVKSSLRVPEYPDSEVGRVVAVHEIELTEIRSVHISPFTKQSTPSVDIALKITATIEPLIPFRSRELRIGESLDVIGANATLASLSDLIGSVPPRVEARRDSFTAYATVGLKLVGKREPPSFEFASIAFDTPAIRGLKRAALLRELKS